MLDGRGFDDGLKRKRLLANSLSLHKKEFIVVANSLPLHKKSL